MASAERDPNARETFEAGQLTIHVDEQGEICSVALEGELDLESASRFERELEARLQDGHRTVVLDLAQLVFIDSTGLQCLLRLTRLSQAGDDALRILPPSGQVERLLNLTKVGDALPIVTGPPWHDQDRGRPS